MNDLHFVVMIHPHDIQNMEKYIYSFQLIHFIADLNKENKQGTAETVFGRENLSDCGLPPYILEALCRVTTDAARSLERMYFDKESGGYIWSEKN